MNQLEQMLRASVVDMVVNYQDYSYGKPLLLKGHNNKEIGELLRQYDSTLEINYTQKPKIDYYVINLNDRLITNLYDILGGQKDPKNA